MTERIVRSRAALEQYARGGGTGPLNMVGLYFRLDEIIKLNRPIKLKDVPLNMQMVYLTAGSDSG